MAIDYESLRRFARANGDVKMSAPRSEISILKDGSPQFFDVIEKATTFVVAGKEYTREQFERLLRSETAE